MRSFFLRVSVAILSYLTAAACSGNGSVQEVPEAVRGMENVTVYSEADVAEADTMRLIREQVFRDSDEDPITSFGAVVSDSFDRLFVGDSQQKAVHVFQPDGRYMGKFGREGRGPGEFLWVGGMNILNNRLYVNDPNGRRVNLFDPGLDARELPSYETSIAIGSDSWENFPESGFMNPAFYTMRSDNSILLISRTSPLLYREHRDSIGVKKYYRWSGESDDRPAEVFEIAEPKHLVTEWFIIPPPFASRELAVFAGADRIYFANTEDFLIQTHDGNGNFMSADYYPFEKPGLTRTDAVKSVDHEQLKNAVETMTLPDTWPAIRSMFADMSGRLWVSVYAENEEVDEWWVLDEDGQLLGRFNLPEETSVAHVRDSHLYVRETNPETGLQQVVRFLIEFGEAQ
jgi:hypothetical protein